MKCKIIIFVLAAAVIVLLWLELFQLKQKRTSAHFIPGTKLELVAKHEPTQLCLYVDTSSTNPHPDYLLCEGNANVIARENTVSNICEYTYFEDGGQILMTRRQQNKIIERTVNYNDASGMAQYTFIDTHGSGLWELFFNHIDNRYYVRSNLCWVPKQ